ncbi:MAG TPA: hypothetical protein VJQ44_10655 [Gemmatimonadales bacterium]|nr:hypothetical protein [Gemmatimonadales bacterium]
MPSRIRPGAAVVAALVLGGCGSERRADAAPADAPPATPAVAAPPSDVLTVTASDYKFDAPDQIPAGMVTVQLVNRGPSPHHVQLLRLTEGKTAADFQAAVQKGSVPAWALPAGGPNPPARGGISEVRMPLEAGEYVMVCFIPDTAGVPHLAHGMLRPLRVTPATSAAASTPASAADVEMTLVDYDFKLSAPLTPGHHVIRVTNAAKQPHELVFVRLEPNKTPADFARWGEHQVGPAPGTLHGGISAIMPGTVADVSVDLPAGDYALLCFVPDRKDGKAHYVHGMSKRMKIG